MNVLDGLLGSLLGGLVGGGDASAEATATTDVEVNPEITVINVLDLEPVRDLVGQVAAVGADQVAAAQAQVTELRNERADTAELWRLVASGAALLYALAR